MWYHVVYLLLEEQNEKKCAIFYRAHSAANYLNVPSNVWSSRQRAKQVPIWGDDAIGAGWDHQEKVNLQVVSQWSWDSDE